MWVKCGIKFAKSNVKYRTTPCLEKLYVHDVLRDKALLAMRHDDYTLASVHTAVKMYDQAAPKYRANVRAGQFYDTGDDLTGTQLIGLGKRLKGDAMYKAKYSAMQLAGYSIAHAACSSHRLLLLILSRLSCFAKLRFISRFGSNNMP